MKIEEINLAKCFACKRFFKINLLVSIYINQEFEESYVKVKRYLCPECLRNLKETNWVRETELERKKIKEDNNGKGKRKTD